MQPFKAISLFAVLCIGLTQLSTAADAPKAEKAGRKSPSDGSLSELALFNRCYTHLTHQRLALNHALRAKVINGTLTAKDACMEVLATGMFETSGDRAGMIAKAPPTPDALAVVKTMNGLHRSWFQNLDLDSVLDSSSFDNTRNVIDETEPALFVTRTLFGGKPFSEIVTASEPIEGIRTDSKDRVIEVATVDSMGNNTITKFEGQQVGELEGIRPVSQVTSKKDNSLPFIAATGLNGKFFNHYGGGILGSVTYFMQNMGLPGANQKANGGISMARRWSKAVYEDLLCRPVPVIRVTDASLYVQRLPVNPAKPGDMPPYRSNRNCMACHASMDPMAGTVRNIIIGRSGRTVIGYNAIALTYQYPVDQAAEKGFVDADANFYRRPANGVLFFRSYDGVLVRKNVAGLKELGQAISEQNDLYACAASRYLEHFTGVKVNLSDLEDPDSQPLTDAEMKYRNWVIQLGLNLKKHQDLRKLIEEIISSDVYRRPSMKLSDSE